MNAFKKGILIIFGLLAILLVGLFIINLILIPKEKSTDNISSGITVNPSPTITYKGLEYSAWMPNWASTSGLDSVKNNPKLFSSISPVWYEVNADGSLKKTYPTNRTQIIEYAHAKGIKLYPTIAMFDHEIFTKVLQDDTNLTNHIASILEEAKSYDGIDLDYESTKLSDKDKYFEFILKLSEGLKKIDKTLIISVIVKWGDDVLYPSLPETRQVQDWAELSKYADEIRIMAYDFTFIKSYFPGPIAPISWVRDCLNYAITKIPREKIVLGVHLYSYEWAIDSKVPYDFIVDMSANKTGDVAAASYNYTQVKSILKDHKGEITEFDNESIFRYADGAKKKTLVYQTPSQLQNRIDLAKEFHIKGVVFWRLGGEDDLLSGLASGGVNP